jgi:carboxymethylenebutenolidase
VSRTVGVDEFIVHFTRTTVIDWLLPGIQPTGCRVEIPMVAIVQFEGDKVAHEHIYWDQASVLVQVGLLDPRGLPVAGAETARKVSCNKKNLDTRKIWNGHGVWPGLMRCRGGSF